MTITNNPKVSTHSTPSLNADSSAASEQLSLLKDIYLAEPKNGAQLISRNKFISHHPTAGINPLVDAAGQLFSMMGKLKRFSFHHHLNNLHIELISDLKNFEHLARAQGYSAEYILVSRYTLCSTLDDVISTTPWGNEGRWNEFSLLSTLNHESTASGQFFIVLEQIVKNPNQYIDLLEFIYICFSLGFKGGYRASEITHNQLEQICNILYKHIRAHYGSFNKTLSPFPIRPIAPDRSPTKTPAGLTLVTTFIIIFSIFISLAFLLEIFSNKPFQALAQIGNILQHENNP